ncbi:hypothetical protein DL93DRAFT_503607 [Clavulina sp. PMI_390]|nr:hypothetical protein DL93DRAFT_503607 [Clavulina sp. PMI_390]
MHTSYSESTFPGGLPVAVDRSIMLPREFSGIQINLASNPPNSAGVAPRPANGEGVNEKGPVSGAPRERTGRSTSLRSSLRRTSVMEGPGSPSGPMRTPDRMETPRGASQTSAAPVT